MTVSTLPLSDIVDVTVAVSPQAIAPPKFNQALIIGTSGNIPTYGANSRCIKFTGATSILRQMLDYGFSLTSPEYLGAAQYLAQSGPPYILWIGRQDTTAVGTFIIHSGAAGTGYVVGDLVTAVQGGGSNCVLKVAAATAGVPTALQFITQGTGYTTGTAVPTTGGTGTGLEIDILSIGESCLEAAIACRLASPEWYLFTCLASADADNIACAEWAQTAAPVCQLFFQTASANALTGVGDIFTTLKAGNFNRYQGVYTTTQGGAAPNNTYFACALMGLAMGLNTGFANSYFTLTNKIIVGMTAEPLTQLQFNILSGNFGNAYCLYGGSFLSYSTGQTGSGEYFDQILGIDMLAADLQYEEANVLYQYGSVPQNDAGQSVFLHAADTACQKSVTRGFLSSGTWTRATVLNLTAGTSMPNGFLNQSPSYASLGAKPANRASAPIYCAVILAEAVQQIVIAVNVQQ